MNGRLQVLDGDSERDLLLGEPHLQFGAEVGRHEQIGRTSIACVVPQVQTFDSMTIDSLKAEVEVYSPSTTP